MTLGVAGILCTLSVEGSLLAESETFTLTRNQETIDLTNRDSAWWRESISGLRDWEISGEGLYIYNDLAKKKLDYHVNARSPATLTIILTLADGSNTVTGEAIVTNLTYSAPPHDKASASFTLKGAGALTASPVS